MRARFQYMKYPSAIIYQTPQQAYLILSGPSIIYETRPKHKKRAGISLQCTHRSQPQQYAQLSSKQCLHTHMQPHHSKTSTSSQLRRRQNSLYENKYQAPSKARHHPTSFSFRDLNSFQPKYQIRCNHNKLLSEENTCLRKENKFLQDYIHTLQLKSKKSAGKKEKDRSEKARIQKYQSTRNSFMRRNIEGSQKNSEEEGSTFGKRMVSSKGESEFTEYRN